MIIKTISHLKKYNFSNELKLYLMNLEKIDFHQVCVFPYNILIMVKDDDQTEESYIFNKQTNERYQLTPGNYYFIPSGMTVEYCLRPNITYYTFHLGLEVYPGIDLYFSFQQIMMGDATCWIRRIDEVYYEKDEFRALCRLRQVLLAFFIDHWPEKTLKPPAIPDEFCDMMQYIRISVDATMTVNTLAERMKMTSEAFSRKFHRLIATPPKAFIMKCLLEKITSQLCDTDKTIRQISTELQFSSEFYLSRFFKKAMGIPPLAYKSMVKRKHDS